MRALAGLFALVLLAPTASACGSDAPSGTEALDAGADAAALRPESGAPVIVLPEDAGAPGAARDAGPMATDAGPDAGHSPGGGGGGSDGGGVPLGPTMSGQATFYDADGTGACGYPASANFHVCAMNMDEFSRAMCGECLEVKGPNGTTTVRVTDDCPGCHDGGLDLSETAFDEIAPMSAGRVDISWFVVSCPPDLKSP